MPIEPEDALGTDVELVFPPDLPGTTFRVETYHYCAAEEVQDETGTDYPEYGLWLPVENGDAPAFVAAPLALREELDRLDAAGGDMFTVDYADRPHDDANWDVTLEPAGDGAQTRL